VLFLVSMAMVGLGLIGEYVGRMYQVVRTRERYRVREILDTHVPASATQTVDLKL